MNLKFIPGMICTYCERQLKPPVSSALALGFTEDHVIPKARGGKKTVPACHRCNNLKGDLDPRDWADFMVAHPRWWKTFRTHREVRAVIRDIPAIRDRKAYETHMVEIRL